MAHEESETVQGIDGRWYNVFGKNTANAYTKLPNTKSYDTSGIADMEAARRSYFTDPELWNSPYAVQRYGPTKNLWRSQSSML